MTGPLCIAIPSRPLVRALGLPVALCIVLLPSRAPTQPSPYPWPHAAEVAPLSARFAPPPGFHRLAVRENAEGTWLRDLPLLPGRPEVRLYDGSAKQNQTAQVAVLDVDVGAKDLQQCADAVMRLRAEYLFATGRDAEVCFHFTSGDPVRWSEWSRGIRPVVLGNRVRWTPAHGPGAAPDARAAAHAEFRRYLDTVFTYAGSASLERDVETPAAGARLEPGDVLLQGGHPGHAVTVLDVAENAAGERVYLLAQSYMPAQQIHVLHAPGSALDPWYTADPSGPVSTPEWSFPAHSWRRFRARPCGPAPALAPSEHP